VVIQALPQQVVVVTKDLLVLRVLRVLLAIEVHKAPRDQRALPPQAVVETKVQLVLKDLWVELQVLALWVQ
jgi:hypothetical protein